MNRKVILGYVFIILSAIIFGCNPLLVKGIQNEGINSLSLVLMRNMLSIPVLAILAFRQHKTLRVPKKALPSIGCIGMVGCCLTPILLFSSYSYIASGTATVFHFIYPAVVVVAGALLFREKINRGTALSVLICIVGICLFYDPSEPINWMGSMFALVSGITYAIYILQLSRFRFPEVSGFLFRVIYGGILINVEVSKWLYLMIIFGSFYMGFGKRRNEITKNGTKSRKVLNLYSEEFLDKNMYVALTLAMVCYILWSVDPITTSRIQNDYLFWTIPIVMVIFQLYSLNIEGNSHGDPIEVVLSDKTLLTTILIYVVVMILLIYII